MADKGTVPFRELLSNIVDNRGKTCPTAPAGRPLIATNCIKNEQLYPSYETERYVDNETYKTWFRGHPEPGDLLFVTKGSPGRTCMVPDPVDFCIAQDMVAIRADNTKVYPRFLFALLRSRRVQEQIDQLHVGTMIPHFKKGDFDKLHLQLPERTTQKFVGDLYYNLSAKIELNRRRNRTLEAMARAIFQSWFVDFDPVKAKAAGRTPPGLSPALAALFPDSFTDSPPGPIPKGWRVATLGDLLTLQRGFDLPTPKRIPGRYKVIAASGENGTHNEFMVRGPGVTTGRSGVLGKVFFVTEDYWPLNTSLWVKEFKECTPAFAFHQLSQIDFGVLNAGSAVPTLNRNHVHNLPVAIPPRSIVDAFDRMALALIGGQTAVNEESRTLAALRDALLPKLISGELRVPDVERTVETAHA